MYSFAELNDFIIKHTDAKYFDDDLRLYKKHFPNSKLIPELERAPDYAKRNLDERMLYELLNNQDSCVDCIWENRGFIFDGSILVPINAKDESAAQMSPEMQVILAELLKSDLSTLKHNDLKKFVFGLELDKKCPNHKKETYLKVLNEFIKSLKPTELLKSHSDQVVDLMNNKNKELAEKIENLELENEDLKDEIEDHELQKEDIEAQLEDAESEKEALKEQANNLAAELEEAKKKEDLE
ncbi:MAG: hypothetical protein JZU49_00155 [Sulfuricurvum sp.]|nr:hypothetical protein [Sulfuricurvum sp.]